MSEVNAPSNQSVNPSSAPPSPPTKHGAAFFRQSGWLMMATIGGGGLMWAVHFLSKMVPASEYGLFGTMLAVVSCVPVMPLQMMFAQQSAKAMAEGRDGELAGMLRITGIFLLAALGLAALGVALEQGPLEQYFKLQGPADLWLMVGILFFSVCVPVLSGVMQGRQNFLWLGWVQIVNAAGRFAVAAGLVLALHWWSAGMLTGVLLGGIGAAGLAAWQCQPVWRRKAEKFAAGPVLAQVVPLLFGFGAVQFLFAADTLFVMKFFPAEQTGYYVGAGTLARALLWVVLPLAQVMFPKLVYSSARKEKTNLMGMVLLGTVILSACGAVGLTLLRHTLIRFVFKAEYVDIGAEILPWYAWAMVPLALANVLANGVLAQGRFRVVPVLAVLGIGYGLALCQWHASLIQVLQIMGGFNVLLLAICAVFTWLVPARPATPKS